MNRSPLTVTQRGRVRWLQLARPERRNALDGDLIAALRSQVDDIEADAGTDVTVVRGDGVSFSAGGDFRHFLAVADDDGPMEFLSRVSECFAAIESSTKPWVAALHGHAIAGGLELALVCDIVIAAAGTVVGDGHIRNSLMPGGGSSVRLERAVGRGIARWMHLSGEFVPVEALASTGWIHEIVPLAALDAAAVAVSDTLAGHAGIAQRNFKRLLNELQNDDLQQGLARELAAFANNWRETDAPAALRDFLERSQPVIPLESEASR